MRLARETWIDGPRTVVATVTVGGQDMFTLIKYDDAYVWEVIAQAGYDGFIRYQYDSRLEARAQWKEWVDERMSWFMDRISSER